MKFLKLGDWHLGIKKDDPWYQNIQMDGIDQAIEYSVKNNIQHWLQAGDVFDTRSSVSHKTMEFRRKIFDKIKEAGIIVYILVGNHDMHNKDTINPNAVSELLNLYDNIVIIDKPQKINLGVDIDMIPWICKENKSDVMEYIKNSKSKYCMGHFELNGFYFYKGLQSHGDDPKFLEKYKQVWSGHFHTISENKNVLYLGTPWTLTAGDENDIRGFWEFDTETEESLFIKNVNMWHRKISYPTDVSLEHFKNLSVRVTVDKIDKDFTQFENQLESIVHELKIIQKIDISSDFSIEENEDTEIKSLIDLMNDYIDETNETEENKESLKIIAKELYLGVL